MPSVLRNAAGPQSKMWFPVSSTRSVPMSSSKPMFSGALQKRSVSEPGFGGGQSSAKATSLLMWVISPVRNQSPMSRAG